MNRHFVNRHPDALIGRRVRAPQAGMLLKDGGVAGFCWGGPGGGAGAGRCSAIGHWAAQREAVFESLAQGRQSRVLSK